MSIDMVVNGSGHYYLIASFGVRFRHRIFQARASP